MHFLIYYTMNQLIVAALIWSMTTNIFNWYQYRKWTKQDIEKKQILNDIQRHNILRHASFWTLFPVIIQKNLYNFIIQNQQFPMLFEQQRKISKKLNNQKKKKNLSRAKPQLNNRN